MNDPEPPAEPIKPMSRKAFQAVSQALVDRLCDLFPKNLESVLNVGHYIITRERDIRRGSWMLVHDDIPGITTIEIDIRLSDIWPQSKS